MFSKRIISALMAAGAFATPGIAAAEQLAVEQQAITATEAITVSAQEIVRPIAAPSPSKANSHMLSDSDLGDQRGGAAILVSDQTLTAVTEGNVVNGGFTAGNVTLSDNALSGFNGVGNVLINTGAQVSLQGGVNLTINVDGE